MELQAGGVRASTRHQSVALRPVARSSSNCAVMVMWLVERGTNGACCTFRISGAMLALATELARPGVPLVLAARQFWPY